MSNEALAFPKLEKFAIKSIQTNIDTFKLAPSIQYQLDINNDVGFTIPSNEKGEIQQSIFLLLNLKTTLKGEPAQGKPSEVFGEITCAYLAQFNLTKDYPAETIQEQLEKEPAVANSLVSQVMVLGSNHLKRLLEEMGFNPRNIPATFL